MASPGASALDESTTLELSGDLLVIPLGATEQHGPHLPLGTDTIIATALAASLDAVVAPALPFGSSGEHAGFAGTLSIGREALIRVLVELVRSSSLPRTLFVNAHGGNAEPLAADRQRAREPGVLAAGSERQRGRDDRVQRRGQRPRDERVGAKRQVRSVLLGRPERDDQQVAAHLERRRLVKRRGAGRSHPG